MAGDTCVSLYPKRILSLSFLSDINITLRNATCIAVLAFLILSLASISAVAQESVYQLSTRIGSWSLDGFEFIKNIFEESVWHQPYYLEFLPEEIIISVLPASRFAFFLVGVLTMTPLPAPRPSY